uniref:Endonuclease/exonuclease/phosphatase domain-containing protein n=1 Tax=Neospora caninum (strain Liverpool) TaxID=572307 RepID=A0A0F7UDP3_NEOCL|nr:TPA: hypothetical protein BN1204_022690 [Neospora caninum Liverpool]
MKKLRLIGRTSPLAKMVYLTLFFLGLLAFAAASASVGIATEETGLSHHHATGRSLSIRADAFRALAPEDGIVELENYGMEEPFSVVDPVPRRVSSPGASTGGAVSVAGSETRRQLQPSPSFLSIGNLSELLSRPASDEPSFLTNLENVRTFPAEEGRLSVFESAASVRAPRTQSRWSGWRSSLRLVGSRISQYFRRKARAARRMMNLLRLQYRDRRKLSRITDDITREELWMLANGAVPSTAREAELAKTVGSKPGYPAPVMACEQHQEVSLLPVEPVSYQPSLASTAASETSLDDSDASSDTDETANTSGGPLESDETPLIQPSSESAASLLAEMRANYKANVVQFSQAKTADMEERMISRHGSRIRPLRIGLFQWNTELFKPNPLEIVLPFCRERPDGDGKPVIDPEEIDMFFVTTQENNRLSPAEEMTMRESVLNSLNTLSATPNWTSSGLLQLNNRKGTVIRKWKVFTPNTQMIMWFARDTVEFQQAPEVCMGSMKSEEKGFVGVKVTVAGVGKVLIGGLHIDSKRKKAGQLKNILDMMAANCGGEGNLDAFDLVVISGDFNSRLDAQTSNEVLTGVSAIPPFTSYLDSRGGFLREQRLLKALQEGYRSKQSVFEQRVTPVLFTIDAMVPSVSEQSGRRYLSTALREAGFSSISTCYRGGFSYPWKKDCHPCPEGQCDTVSIATIMKRCFSSSGLEKASSTGFLDRVAIRTRGDAAAFFIKSHTYFNMRSDHKPYSFVLHLFGSRTMDAS